mgnify:CR=1 FL=1
MTEQLFVGFHHFAMRTPDLQRSITFYEALGFRQVHEWALPNYGIKRAVMMQAADNKSWIEIFDLKAGIPMQGRGAKVGEAIATGALAHICLTVNDLEKACARIVEAGATHLHGPENLGLGQPEVSVLNAIFEGPAGEVIELLKHVRFPGDLPEAV